MSSNSASYIQNICHRVVVVVGGGVVVVVVVVGVGVAPLSYQISYHTIRSRILGGYFCQLVNVKTVY